MEDAGPIELIREPSCGVVAAVEDLKTTSESTWFEVSSSLRLIIATTTLSLAVSGVLTGVRSTIHSSCLQRTFVKFLEGHKSQIECNKTENQFSPRPRLKHFLVSKPFKDFSWLFRTFSRLSRLFNACQCLSILVNSC